MRKQLIAVTALGVAAFGLIAPTAANAAPTQAKTTYTAVPASTASAGQTVRKYRTVRRADGSTYRQWRTVSVTTRTGRSTTALSTTRKSSLTASTRATTKRATASRSATRSGSGVESRRACIINRESRGNYSAQNARSTASGAYQFLDSTWRSVTGLSGSAKDYSAATQDAAFYKLFANGAGAGHWGYAC